ncbi:MAG TPA: hypothetical protein VN598_10665 [Usitatibacter sp.]|nr:hypothetical protein [Usitatibacter sp.]
MAAHAEGGTPMPMDMEMDMGTDMASQFGPYPMSREGSGTAWQPEATPMHGLMFHSGSWMTMLHGFANTVYDRQGGPRGDEKTFTSSMLMVMASRPLGGGTLGLRSMLSLDPAMGRGGYPLLLQTGETANGVSALVDRQHPHDAFMELSAAYSIPIAAGSAAYLYAGLPGEPALGPSTFMHRFSGAVNPEAPLTHHWLDSTHVTMGVVTLGASAGPWKVEGSRFNGREPDQNRWNIEIRRFDSSSARLSYNPSSRWSAQVSYGNLASPEGLEPEVRVRRTTASVMYQAKLADRAWGTTLAWGRNDKRAAGNDRKLDGWLLESALELTGADTVFGRAERVNNDELFPDADPRHGDVAQVGKITLGVIHDFASTGPVKWGIGALASAYRIPGALQPSYGAHPRSFMVFLQGRL